MSKKKAGAYALGVLTIIGGAFVGKYLTQEAGAALVAAGAFFLGKIQEQPRSMRGGPKPPPLPHTEQ